MSDQFLAEIRIFPFNFPPTGWAFCDGQLMPISQNTALFSLLGTYYGGDGKSTFALPDMQGNSARLHSPCCGACPGALPKLGPTCRSSGCFRSRSLRTARSRCHGTVNCARR